MVFKTIAFPPVSPITQTQIGSFGGTRTLNNIVLSDTRLPVAPRSHIWCPMKDSNPQQDDLESSASANCANWAKLVEDYGVEPSDSRHTYISQRFYRPPCGKSSYKLAQSDGLEPPHLLQLLLVFRTNPLPIRVMTANWPSQRDLNSCYQDENLVS